MTLRKLALCLSLMMVVGVASIAAQEKVGKVSFPTSCNAEVQAEFDRAIAALHSFYHTASLNTLAGVLQKDPGCAMAYWGIAMNALGNPFGWPPSAKGLADGSLDPWAEKRRLAREVVDLYQGDGAGAAAEARFDRVHRERELPDEIPDVAIPPEVIVGGSVYLPALLALLGLADSNSHARRLIEQGGVRLGGKRVSGDALELPVAELRGRVLQVGRRGFARLA